MKDGIQLSLMFIASAADDNSGGLIRFPCLVRVGCQTAMVGTYEKICWFDGVCNLLKTATIQIAGQCDRA